MAHEALKCPDCGYAKAYPGRGTCRCGAYLVKHWAGENRGRMLAVLSHRRCWLWDDSEGKWHLINDPEENKRERGKQWLTALTERP